MTGAAVLLLVFAAGLRRRLAARPRPGACSPSRRGRPLLTAVAALMGTGLTPSSSSASSDDAVDPRPGVRRVLRALDRHHPVAVARRRRRRLAVAVAALRHAAARAGSAGSASSSAASPCCSGSRRCSTWPASPGPSGCSSLGLGLRLRRPPPRARSAASTRLGPTVRVSAHSTSPLRCRHHERWTPTARRPAAPGWPRRSPWSPGCLPSSRSSCWSLGRPPMDQNLWFFVVDFTVACVYGTVAAVILSRRAHPVPWLLALAAVGGGARRVRLRATAGAGRPHPADLPPRRGRRAAPGHRLGAGHAGPLPGRPVAGPRPPAGPGPWAGLVAGAALTVVLTVAARSSSSTTGQRRCYWRRRRRSGLLDRGGVGWRRRRTGPVRRSATGSAGSPLGTAVIAALVPAAVPRPGDLRLPLWFTPSCTCLAGGLPGRGAGRRAAQPDVGPRPGRSAAPSSPGCSRSAAARRLRRGHARASPGWCPATGCRSCSPPRRSRSRVQPARLVAGTPGAPPRVRRRRRPGARRPPDRLASWAASPHRRGAARRADADVGRVAAARVGRPSSADGTASPVAVGRADRRRRPRSTLEHRGERVGGLEVTAPPGESLSTRATADRSTTCSSVVAAARGASPARRRTSSGLRDAADRASGWRSAG